MRRGTRLEKLFAGATTLAARFVERVAITRTASANRPRRGLSDAAVRRANRSIGFQIASPYRITVALVTATPMKANSGIVLSRPRACPRIWAFWLFA